MTIFINSKRTPPPPRQGTFNRRLKFAALLSAVLAASLLLSACPSPGGGGTGTAGGGEGTTNPGGGGGTGTTTPTTYTTTVTGTITASAPGETSSIDLPGATVSAVTTPANSANRPVTSGPDGAFTLQVKHSGSFRIKVGNTCSEPFTTDAVTASADGSHNAGALQLTLKSEPAGNARYSFTEKSTGKFKLTVSNCVREIGNREFNANGTIITAKAREISATLNPLTIIAEIDLPPTLTKIGEDAFNLNLLVTGTLVIPRNVETIMTRALDAVGSNPTANPDGYTLSFEAGSKLKFIGGDAFQSNRLKDFRLPENLETIDAGAFQSARFFFSTGFSPAGTLTIPAKVSKIGERAFARSSSGGSGITTVDIRSRQLAKPAGAVAADFPLQPNLFENVTGITSITLPAEVYDSYTKAQLQAVFGSTFINYRRPDGTAYDFAAKS